MYMKFCPGCHWPEWSRLLPICEYYRAQRNHITLKIPNPSLNYFKGPV